MKLILKNFKCWQDKIIDLGDSGITLLNGPSGIGKSSIFCAIHFVITGEGKNIMANGATTLKAELITNNYHIIRTRRPNRLVFKSGSKEYEDDEAQFQINKIFSSLFPVISYINQNDTESFLKMSSTDKLTFLETIAFQNIDISEKKDKIKGITKERSNRLIAASSKMESLNDVLQSVKEVKMPTFPIKCKPDEEDKIIEKYQRLEKVKQQKLTDITLAISHLKLQLSSISNMEEKITMLSEEQATVSNNIITINSELEKTNYNEAEYNRLLKEISELDEMEKNFNRLNECFQTEKILLKKREDSQHKLASISTNTLWQEGTESDTKEALESLNTYLADVKRYSDYKNNLESLLSRKKKLESSLTYDTEELQKQISDLQQKVESYNLSKVLFSCPDCNCKLSIVNRSIKKYVGDVVTQDPTSQLQERMKALDDTRSILEKLATINTKIDDVNTQISEITESYDSIQTEEEIQENIRDYKSYLEKNQKLEKSIDVEKRTAEKILQNIADELEKLSADKSKYELLSENYDANHHRNCKNLLSDIKSAKKTHDNQSHLLRSFEDRMKEIEKHIIGYNSKILEKASINRELEESESQKVTIEEDLKKIEIANQKINVYITTKKEYLNWITIKDKYESAKQEEINAKEELDAINLLREKFLLSESIYLNNFIISLNTHLQSYIDTFFIDEPMVVNIKPFKTVKKDVQPQINLEIGYKGMDCDISTLSGGERDRLNLAFTLSFSELMNTPVLLLDECISSLDYGNFNNVLGSLKENYKGKLIVLISHQANEGLFDKTIELK